MILIGYSGHAYVAAGILKAAGITVNSYCDKEEKTNNPFQLAYLGPESSDDAKKALKENDFFIAVGDNKTRREIFEQMAGEGILPVNAIHPSLLKDPTAFISKEGVMISAGVIINPLVKIGRGVICNTGCIIEHECIIEDFAHIGPGAVLCGNVTIGKNSFVGAGAVVRQGIRIGAGVIIGAGAVVVNDITDGAVVKGCPAR